MKHTYDEICKCLNIFSGSIYIKQTTALFFVSFFNEGNKYYQVQFLKPSIFNFKM